MDARRIELLAGMPIFGGLRDDVLARLGDRATARQVPAGELFFREGDRGGSAFVLEAGRIAVEKRWQGRDHVLRELGPGDCFGEIALVDFCARSASIRAVTDCRAIELSARHLRDVLGADLEQYALFYTNVARELARRLRDADDRIFRARFGAPDVEAGYPFAP
jgi:CRP-like cAMP-binding protein